MCSKFVAKIFKVFFVLHFMLMFNTIGSNKAFAARLDGIGNKETVLTGNATVSGNIQNMSNTSSAGTIIDGQGFSINGSGFTSNGSSGAWLRYTSSFTGTGLHNKILNVGKFELTPLLSGATGDSIIKLNEKNEAIRYNISESGSIHGFTSTGGSKGGSFIYSGDRLTIDNTVIKGNKNTAGTTGAKGGAVFYGNNAADGAGLTVSNSYVTENCREWLKSYSTVSGGAIFSQQKNGIFSIKDSYFTKNYVKGNPLVTTSYSANGGAISNDSGRLQIEGSYFGNNYVSGAKSEGGAVWANGYTPETGVEFKPHTINKTVFENNSVTGTKPGASGGALYVLNDVDIADSLFVSNKTIINPTDEYTASYNYATTAKGGAVFKGDNVIGDLASNPNLKFNATLNVKDTVFKDNEIQFKEGALALKEGSSASGGAVHLSNSISNIDKTVFSGNKVVSEYTASDVIASGGAIATSSASGNRKGKHFITAAFDNNSVTSEGTAQGGAIAALDVAKTDNVVTVNIDNSSITNNTAVSKGSIANAGAMGGAIYAGKLNFVNLNNSVIDSNAASSSSSNSGDVKYGGGGAYVADKAILTATDTSFTNNKATGTAASGGAIFVAKGGTANVIALNDNVVFEGNTANGESNAIHSAGGTLNLNSAAEKSIVFNDKITSSNDASITINKEGTWDKEKWPYTNRIPEDAPHGENTGKVVLNADMTEYKGTVDLYGGTIEVGKDGTFFDNAKAFNVNAASNLNVANGVIQTYNFGNLSLKASLNTAVDADLAAGTADKFSANTVKSENGAIININHINVITDANSEFSEIKLTDSDEIQSLISLGDGAKKALGKLYKYDVMLNDEGWLEFEKVGGSSSGGNNSYEAYNPSVFAASVTMQAMAQAGVREVMNYGFEHSDSFTKLPSKERFSLLHGNEYAISEFNGLLPGYDEQLENKGFWLRPYTVFEKINLKHGPDVDNISYGSLVGYDSKARKTKRGWTSTLSSYLAYFGSSLGYDDVDVITNGWLLGFTKSYYKKNFWTAVSASGGVGLGRISESAGKDDVISANAGVSLRNGYNMEFGEGRFIIQPITSASYYFANVFDYTNARGARLDSAPLSALELRPGMRLIANTESGWQPYISGSYVWNLFNQTNVKADGIKLPEMYVDPYVEYGVGVQKNKGDNFTCFLQSMMRMGGRTGVSLTGGLRWAVGTDKSKKKSKKSKTRV